MGAAANRAAAPNVSTKVIERGLKMLQSKWIRFLCCVFVLPLALVFSSPGAAVAAQSEILKATLNADWIDNASMFGDANCTLPIGMGEPNGAGAVSVVLKGAYCYAGPDFTPGYCWGFESSCSEYSFAIKGDGDGTCASADLTDYEGEKDGISKIHTRFQEVSFLISNCDPVEVCLTGHPTGGNAVTACVPTSLQVEEAEDAEGCLYTNYQPVPTPRVDDISVVQVFSSSWRVILTIKGQMPGPESGSVGWRFYVHGFHIPGNDTTPIINGGTTEINTGFTFGVAAGGESPYTYVGESDLISSVEEAEQFAEDLVVSGIGVYLVMPGDNPGALGAVPLPNGANPDGKIGISNPNRCAYYWGDKIAEYGAPSPYDEPIGPILDDSGPVDVPVPEDPDPEDPGPEPTGFDWWELIGHVLDFLGRMFDSLIDAIGEVVGAIGDLLELLFIPDPDSWGIDDLVEQLQNKPPFSLLEPLADEALAVGDSIGAAGDCGSLADFSGGGIPIHVDCSDVRNAPGMNALYQLVKVGLLAFTGLYIFRMFSELLQEGQ